ncbi:hypothetical protein [Helicobacter bilis]|uniref:hypothetical protein n=1 Tax=Helicobacter bilis TaxID=37372 RepID=UPI0026F09264|nr:hypothetical protein [Helicobacter bilis]MCI7411640.1 hypothetical protein [Helicobacter bilis]MDY4400652.1 hypothetical protein [Helicobacter bilis]
MRENITKYAYIINLCYFTKYIWRYLCLCFLMSFCLYAVENNTDKDIESKNKANPYNIDYPNLDSKYYPYIRSRNKFYDKDIAKIIENVDRAEAKNAFFIGAAYGFNINAALPFFVDAGIIGTQNTKSATPNFSLFGFRVGYQKYTGKMLPINHFGYQIYIDFCVSLGKSGLFFTGINADMLWDFLELHGFIGSLNLGVGLGSSKITGLAISPYADKYEAAYRLNLGISVRYPRLHHKAGIYFGSTQGTERGFLGYTMMIGYDYVF